jgi:hypothetical protein
LPLCDLTLPAGAREQTDFGDPAFDGFCTYVQLFPNSFLHDDSKL